MRAGGSGCDRGAFAESCPKPGQPAFRRAARRLRCIQNSDRHLAHSGAGAPHAHVAPRVQATHMLRPCAPALPLPTPACTLVTQLQGLNNPSRMPVTAPTAPRCFPALPPARSPTDCSLLAARLISAAPWRAALLRLAGWRLFPRAHSPRLRRRAAHRRGLVAAAPLACRRGCSPGRRRLQGGRWRLSCTGTLIKNVINWHAM